MNPAASQHIAELATLTKAYLLQEARADEWLFVERSNHAYFKELAQKQPLAKPIEPAFKPAPAPVHAAAPQAPIKPYVPPPLPPVKPIALPQPQPNAKSNQAIEEAPAPKKILAPTEFFTREPLTKNTLVDLSDIRTIVTEKFPQITFIDAIPAPELKPPPSVALFTLSNNLETLDFLQKVGKAVQDRFGSAEVLSAHSWEKEKGWEKTVSNPQIKLILISHEDLDLLPELKQYHREITNKHMLGSVRMIPLAPLTAYQTDLKLKAHLWKSICEHLQS